MTNIKNNKINFIKKIKNKFKMFWKLLISLIYLMFKMKEVLIKNQMKIIKIKFTINKDIVQICKIKFMIFTIKITNYQIFFPRAKL